VRSKAPRPAEKVGVRDVLRRFDIDFGLGFLRPASVVDHALLKFTDAGQVFVELVAVFAAEMAAHRFGLVADVVEDAATIFEASQLVLHIVGFAFEEETGEDLGGRVVGGNERAGATRESAGVAGQGEAGEARLRADVPGGVLTSEWRCGSRVCLRRECR
jgi:hypothetical protein